ncbi:MAG: 4Fe-4S binding protein [Candidatus Thermoplasmatota archaeon]|jgi:NAD-dependent dihydropyrimidine dehydrogenase PreA subunit|nr:4Fe-4S binding protein [Candidatus Thermoplasmatota archaeon]MDP7265114.1 4Fe-4S binding protein [Candidatus Thermoplasmatota archaeon]
MFSKKNKVTISYRRPYFTRLTSINQRNIEELIKKGKVRVIYDSVIKKIGRDKVILEIRNIGNRKMRYHDVFLELGRRPNKEFLTSIGVKFGSDLTIKDRMRTAWKNKVIKRDVIGGILLFVFAFLFYFYMKRSSYTSLPAPSIGGYELSFYYITIYTFGVMALGLWFVYRFRKARNRKLMFVRMIFIMLIQLSVGYVFANPSANPIMRQWTGNDFFTWEAYQLSIVWPLELQPLVWNWLEMSWVNWEFYLGWVVIFSFIGVPVGAFLLGKGFYCSGVCGCGALAETVGDPFRSKSLKNKFAYRLEYSKYVILGISVVLTFIMIENEIFETNPQSPYYHVSYLVYWIFILVFLSSIIGVGTYPFLSGRTWCRYFCPMAALLSIFSMISPNRIETYKERCIGCNKCNENCQYGINIKGKALLGKPVRTRECVQCGVCEAVCPTDALRAQFTIYRRKKGVVPSESSYKPYRHFGGLR